MAVGHLRFAGLDRLDADLPREVLGRHLAVSVHQHQQRSGLLVLHDQGLDHGVGVPAQHLGAVLGPAMLHVLVGMLGVVHPVRLQQLGGGGL